MRQQRLGQLFQRHPVSYGDRTTTADRLQDGTTQSGQERSLVGSNQGDLTIRAGDAVQVSGSDLAAGRDIDLAAQRVTIDAGQDTTQGKVVTRMEQDAFTLAVGGTVASQCSQPRRHDTRQCVGIAY